MKYEHYANLIYKMRTLYELDIIKAHELITELSKMQYKVNKMLGPSLALSKRICSASFC